jgi:hypothetical protein
MNFIRFFSLLSPSGLVGGVQGIPALRQGRAYSVSTRSNFLSFITAAMISAPKSGRNKQGRAVTSNRVHTLAYPCPALLISSLSLPAYARHRMNEVSISSTPTPPIPDAAPVAPTDPVAPMAAPPTAALVVINGDKTERELQLEKQLADAQSDTRKAQTDASYAQDEARRLKEIQTRPPPKPAKRKPWLVTLLHDPEDI